jgi:hypothetical protein
LWSTNLGAVSRSAARNEIDPGGGSLWPAHRHPDYFRELCRYGFGRSLAALLWMSTVLSAVVGAVRREPLFDTTLNHWDETAAYAALCCLTIIFHHAAAL